MRREESVKVPTAANVNFQSWAIQWHYHYSLATNIIGAGTRIQEVFCFAEYTPIKFFKNFVQSAVKAPCEVDENLNSNVVAETLELLANSSHGYQITDGNSHSFTKYTNDKKTHAAINKKKFKRLEHKNDHYHEIELVEFEIDHTEAIIVGFFILQYANFRLLEFHYNFFTNLCDTDNTRRWKAEPIHCISH